MTPLTVRQRWLVARHRTLPWWVARNMQRAAHPALHRLGLEEAALVGQLAIVQAVREHDPRKGKFSTLAALAVKRKIISAARSSAYAMVPRTVTALPVLSLDAMSGTDKQRALGITVDRQPQEDYRLSWLESVLGYLTSKERRLLRYRFEKGLSGKQMAWRLNVTPAQVRQLLTNVYRKLRGWAERVG